MLIIKDKAGNTIGVLKDEDNEPKFIKEKIKKESNEKEELTNETKEGEKQ